MILGPASTSLPRGVFPWSFPRSCVETKAGEARCHLLYSPLEPTCVGSLTLKRSELRKGSRQIRSVRVLTKPLDLATASVLTFVSVDPVESGTTR